MNSPRATAYLMMLLVSIIWGVAGPVIKYTLSYFPPLVFLTYRFAISTIIALIYFGWTKEKIPTSSKKLGGILLYSLLAVPVGLGFIFFGFDKTTSLAGSVLSVLGPLATIGAGAIILKEHITQTERSGLLLALAGTLLIIFAPILGNGADELELFGRVEGNVILIIGQIIDVSSALLVKLLLRDRISASVLTHISFVIGFLVIAPLALLSHGGSAFGGILDAPISAHLGVWFMAILSGTIAYTLRNRAVKTIEVSEAALFSYLYPLWAAPLSVLWLKERITPVFLFGSGIIATGVVIAEYKRRKNKKRLRKVHR